VNNYLDILTTLFQFLRLVSTDTASCPKPWRHAVATLSATCKALFKFEHHNPEKVSPVDACGLTN
jgi:hypothetical protein